MSPQTRRRARGEGVVRRADAAGGWGDEAGMTLIEVMVAMVVMAVVLLAVASTAITSLVGLVDARERQAAYTAATRSIELARSYAWDELALRTGDAAVATDTFDPEDGTIDAPGTGETIVHNPAGRVTGAPHVLDEGARRVRTYVTDYTDPGAPEAEQRRVTVVVEWRRGERVSSLRESTVVSQARWGVAQPSFAVAPVDGMLAVQRARQGCLAHTITNRGSNDRYLVRPPTLPSGWNLVEVYEDVDADGVADAGERLAPGARTRTHGFDASFDVLVCYRGDSASAPPVDDARVVIESELEPDVVQQAVHRVAVETQRTVHLRGPGVDGAVRTPGTTYETSLAAPTLAAVPNVDADVDLLPGLLLPRGAAASAAVWRLPFEAPRGVGGATVRLFTSTPAMLEGVPAPSATQTYAVELRRRDASGVVTATVATAAATVPHAAADPTWVARTWALPVTATELAAGESLELAVSCAAASPTDCVVAFDAVPTPAALTVAFP